MGGYCLSYDPKIAYPFIQVEQMTEIKDVELWQTWEFLDCPILSLRGEESDVLLPETIAQMQASKPQMQAINFPEIGHAPALMAEEQIEAIQNWLLT